jgi:hypothetical protein
LRASSVEERSIIERSLPYTMTGVARLLAVVDAVRYCATRDVSGVFVECGVWRGGSVLAMILTLQHLGAAERDIYLYDTFEGMTAPTEDDTSDAEGSAVTEWHDAKQTDRRPWEDVFGEDKFNEDAVRAVLLDTGYPAERLHFIRGPVEKTLPRAAPETLALLRLDTDWYESTRHELNHLFPRLQPGGVLIIDDYGHWRGARKAVDEYFSAEHAPLLLSRIDYTGRMAVKL